MNNTIWKTTAAGGVFMLLSACGGGGGNTPSSVEKPIVVVDSDKDGTPDDSDAAPNDPLCAAASDASNGVCYLRTLAASRLTIVGNANGRVFFKSEDDALRLYAYDMNTRHFLGRTVMTGYTPTTYAYVPEHARLYVGDSNGNIHAYAESMQEDSKVFAKLPQRVGGLAMAGKFLVAQDDSGAWSTHYIYDQLGTLVQSKDWNYYSGHYTWSSALSRLYFFRDSSTPNDLMYETIDQATGKITAAGETPYHGAYEIKGPIRVSASGGKVLLGSGDVYSAPELTWGGNIGKSFNDAAWLQNDELVTLTASGANTRLSRFNTTRKLVEEIEVKGELLGFGQTATANYVIVKHATHVEFASYVPSDDSDGDGVPNWQDRFPLDKTAAVDSDNDGYPDAFLKNYTSADSPTGLTRDFYPNDASCHALEQGDGTNCNYNQLIPAYMPDLTLTDAQGTVYLLHKASQRIYRWSPTKRDYIAPLVVGQAAAYGTTPPSVMTYSASHNRLYFGYANGALTYIDLAGDSRETPFAVLAGAVGGIAAAGNFILAQDPSGAWATHYVLDKQGTITQAKEWNYYSRYYEWNPNQSRMYFFRDDTSPNDLMFEEVDQGSGKIIASGDSPYHGDHNIAGPIRVSPAGGRIVTGAGYIYSTSDLKVVKNLGSGFIDAQWRDDGSLVTISSSGLNTSIATYSPALALVKTELLSGVPKALLRSGATIYVVTQDGSRPSFNLVTP